MNAVGASVGAHCQPCLTYRLAKAKELGIGEDEIREAIAVGHMVEKGAMSASCTPGGGRVADSGRVLFPLDVLKKEQAR